MKVLTFTTRREAAKYAKSIGGTVEEYLETDFVVGAVTRQIFDAYDEGFAKGYEQAKAEDGKHA